MILPDRFGRRLRLGLGLGTSPVRGAVVRLLDPPMSPEILVGSGLILVPGDGPLARPLRPVT